MHYFQGSLAIKILKLKLFYLSTIPTLVLGILILIYFSSIKDFPVFPNTQTFNYRFYSDSTAGGNSKILKQVITDSIIKLDYQIGNKINSPYAGLNVGPKESKSINFGYYNELKIRLKGNEINGIGIALVTQNSLKKSDKKIQDILFYHIFKISSGINLYEISMDKFGVPDWWGENNRIEDASTIKPNLKNLETINVSSAFTDNTGKTQSLEIYSISFSRNNKPLITLTLTLEFAFILLVFAAFYFIEKTREKTQSPKYGINLETINSTIEIGVEIIASIVPLSHSFATTRDVKNVPTIDKIIVRAPDIKKFIDSFVGLNQSLSTIFTVGPGIFLRVFKYLEKTPKAYDSI